MIQKREFYFSSLADALQFKFSADKSNTSYYTTPLQGGTIVAGEPDIPFAAQVYIRTQYDMLLWTHGAFVVSEGSAIVIDSEMSTTSVNPVQNKVITGALAENRVKWYKDNIRNN